MTIRDIAIAFGYEIDKDSESKVNDSINKLKSTAGKVLGAIGIGFSLSQINALVEQYGAINQRLKSTTGQLANQKELQDKIMQSASNTLTSYETTANAVSSYISQSKKVLKTSESALQFTELATKAWKAAGKEEAQIASLHSTLASAFQKNIIDAGTFETILAQSPETIKYLEQTLGKSTTQLRAMANAGVLTASHLTEAFTKSAKEIEEAYAQAPMRISDALKVAKEKVALVLTQTDETMEITKEISKMITKGTDFLINGLRKIMVYVQKFTYLLGGTENALRILGLVIGAVFATKGILAIKKSIPAIKAFISALSPVTIKIALIVAAVAVLLLIIEDVVAFCQGKNSLFGELLKKTGMDVEGTREQIITAWQEVVAAFKDAYDSLKEVFSGLTEAFSAFWEKHGEKILKHLILTVKSVITVVTGALKIVGNLLSAIFKLFSGDFKGAGESLLKAVETYLSTFLQFWQEIIDSWLALFGTSTEEIGSWLSNLGSTISKKAKEIVNSVKNFFTGIISWFKENWVGLLLLLINPFAGALTLLYKNNEKFRNLVDNLLAKIKEAFANFKQKLKDKVAEWKDGIVEGFNAVKTWFEELPGRALQWGKDMLQNFIDGIKEKFPLLSQAISWITGEVDDNLGHSVPKKGPLKDDDKWMPDFMQNLYGGIKKNLPKLREAVGSIASEMSMFISGSPTALTKSISQGATSQRIINQYNNWTNHFNGGTKQEQADLARSSDTQVRQASSKLGTELAYTR